MIHSNDVHIPIAKAQTKESNIHLVNWVRNDLSERLLVLKDQLLDELDVTDEIKINFLMNPKYNNMDAVGRSKLVDYDLGPSTPNWCTDAVVVTNKGNILPLDRENPEHWIANFKTTWELEQKSSIKVCKKSSCGFYF